MVMIVLGMEGYRLLVVPAGIEKQAKCLPVHEIPEEYLGRLTSEELEVLPQICWQKDVHKQLGASNPKNVRRGIPEGVKCNVTTW